MHTTRRAHCHAATGICHPLAARKSYVNKVLFVLCFEPLERQNVQGKIGPKVTKTNLVSFKQELIVLFPNLSHSIIVLVLVLQVRYPVASSLSVAISLLYLEALAVVVAFLSRAFTVFHLGGYCQCSSGSRI